MLIKVIFLLLILVSNLSAETLSTISLTDGMFTTFGLWVNGTLNAVLIETGFYRLLIVISILYSLRKIFTQQNIVEPIIHIIVVVLITFLFIKPGPYSYEFEDIVISETQTAQEEEIRSAFAERFAGYEIKKPITGLGSEPSMWYLKIFNSINKFVNVILDSIDQNYRYSHLKYKTYQINQSIDLGLHDPDLIKEFKLYNEVCYYPAISTFADGNLYNNSSVGTSIKAFSAYGRLSPFYIRDETDLYSRKHDKMDLTVNNCKGKTNELTTSILTKSYDRNHPLYNAREEAVSAGLSLYFFKVGEYTQAEWAEDYITKLYKESNLTKFMMPEKKVDLDENFVARWMHQYSTWKDSIGKYVSVAGILNMYPYVQGITLGFFISIFPIIICYSFFGKYTIIIEYFKMILWIKSWSIVTSLAVLFDKMSVSSEGAGESAMEVALYSMALSAPIVSYALIRVTSVGIATGIMQSAGQSSHAAGASAAGMVDKGVKMGTDALGKVASMPMGGVGGAAVNMATSAGSSTLGGGSSGGPAMLGRTNKFL